MTGESHPEGIGEDESGLRVNLGCDDGYLDGWLNVAADGRVRADAYDDPFDFIIHHGADLSELYFGRLLEELNRDDARALLRLVVSLAPAGTRILAAATDVRAVLRAYVAGDIENERLNDAFIHRATDSSPQMWSYDRGSLLELFRDAGLEQIAEADLFSLPDAGSFEPGTMSLRCAAAGVVGPTRAQDDTVLPGRRTRPRSAANADSSAALTAETMLLGQLGTVHAELNRIRSREQEALKRAGKADQLAAELSDVRQTLDGINRSITFRAAHRASLVARRVLPAGSPQRKAAARVVRALRRSRDEDLSDDASVEIEEGPSRRRRPFRSRLRGTHGGDVGRPRVERAGRGCMFCIAILPGDSQGTRETVESLVAQWWKDWRAVVLTTTLRDAAANNDPRVSVRVTGAGIDAVNSVVSETDADFILILNPGDQLAHSCLQRVMREAHREPLADLVYWDSAPVARPRDRRFRPGWSPDILLSGNYLESAFAIRRTRYHRAGGVRSDAGDAFLWDLILRASLQEQNVIRIPRLLSFHGRVSDLASEAGRRAVEAECVRRGWLASAQLLSGAVRLRWEDPNPPHVSIIVPTRHNRAFLEVLFHGLRTTAYPSFDLIVVDNGRRDAENQEWYVRQSQDLDLNVIWWDRDFNYSAVNNAGASVARGDVLVFLNDDIEVIDASWLSDLVGWTTVDGVGAVGMQLLDPRGNIQHGGVVLGVGGFAAHLFQGLAPGTNTLLGSTSWYRDCIAVTGACLAVRRETFDTVGGFDERFVLCGSDVAFGIALHIQGFRSVCTSLNGLRHIESATRGTEIPIDDFHASYWVYQPWIWGGDPYFSPGLSAASGVPRRRTELDASPLETISTVLGRSFGVFRSTSDLDAAAGFAARYNASEDVKSSVRILHNRNSGPLDVRSINWFIPGLDSPFYGGINTALRIADHLSRNHGVENRFVVVSDRGPARFIRAGIAAAFPELGCSRVELADSRFLLDTVPPADIAIATLWTTAYDVASYSGADRKFYLIQDFEPAFYPAGTIYALAEESYRLGLYGLCNTQRLADIYSRQYEGKAFAFSPAVDRSIFHPVGRHDADLDEPVTIFTYARPGHWRNCWELAYAALGELKKRLGERVRIIAAGSWAIPEDEGLFPIVHQMGLLDYRATGVLYRRCDIGLALTVSQHPSYLPLELMACGVAVVAFDNPAGHWLLETERNCLLAPQTVDGLATALERLVLNPRLRRRLASAGLRRVQERHSSWEQALSGVFGFLCDPQAEGDPQTAGAASRR
jgi:GT2 family glycosyltransferase/glycosyltransferase involved in cell wall biosynthesis